VERLVRVGKLRRNRVPELEILYELFHTAAPVMPCPMCGHAGLTVSNALDDAHAWPGTPDCAACGKPIPRERLEVRPNTRLCAACQGRREQGGAVEERDFCPRCGSPMEVRAVGEGDRVRYVMACSARPPCRV
jgi:transcription elongation factor Elf1